MDRKRSAGSKTKPPNRRRGIRHDFWVTDTEEVTIRKRMADTGITSFSTYVRRMLNAGYHITIDLSDVRELTHLLRECSNLMQQLVNRSRETGNIHEEGIAELQQRMDSLWDIADRILSGLAKIK